MNRSVINRRRFLSSVLLSALASPLAISASTATGTVVEVWKDPTCGCCKKWIAHMQSAGFAVNVHDTGNIPVRERAHIAPQYGSCHTALVGGYAIEGHVPPREVQRLLKERPDAIGLAVPGMVSGSPGMEQGNVHPYTVLLLHKDGGSSSYATYPG